MMQSGRVTRRGRRDDCQPWCAAWGLFLLLSPRGRSGPLPSLIAAIWALFALTPTHSMELFLQTLPKPLVLNYDS